MRRIVVVAVAALPMVVAACANDDAPPATSDLVGAICAAQEAAAAGDTDEARMVFSDRAHEPIHALAADLSDRDRAAEAALLEAKQQVEADFDASGQGLADDLAVLAEATAVAQTANGEPGTGNGCEP